MNTDTFPDSRPQTRGASYPTSDANGYSQRPVSRRLPAVLFASLLLLAALFAMGLSVEGLGWALLLPLVILPLILVFWARG